MKCCCCDRRLTDYDATVKHAVTGEYLDLCGECRSVVFSMASFEVKDRPDLMTEFYDQDPEEYSGTVDDIKGTEYNDL